MKTNQTIKPIISDDCMTVTFEIKGHEPLVLDMRKLSPAVLARAAAVGMAQVRIVDAAAIGRTDAEGVIIPESERTAAKRAAMARLVEHYMTGTEEWAVRGPGSGGGAKSESSLIVRAVAAVQGVTTEVMRERLAALAERKGTTVRKLCNALAGQEAVAREVARLRAEAGAGGPDADGLLDELMEDGEEA